MNNIGLYKKIMFLFSYMKTLYKKSDILKSKYGLRIDRIYRVYTVINVPNELIPEAYDLKKSDIDRISQTYISNYVSNVGNTLDDIGLRELYSVYDIKKVDKYSYLLIIGYKFLKLRKVFWFTLILIILILILFLVINLIK